MKVDSLPHWSLSLFPRTSWQHMLHFPILSKQHCAVKQAEGECTNTISINLAKVTLQTSQFIKIFNPGLAKVQYDICLITDVQYNCFQVISWRTCFQQQASCMQSNQTLIHLSAISWVRRSVYSVIGWRDCLKPHYARFYPCGFPTVKPVNFGFQ